MAANGQMTRLAELMKQAPALMPNNLEQIAALQLGVIRIEVDDLHGHFALQGMVIGAVHSAHPTRAEQCTQFIFTEGLTDKTIEHRSR